MSTLAHEWRLLIRSRLTVAALLLLLMLTTLAVAAGMAQVRTEAATIARLTAMHDAAVSTNRDPTHGGDAGYVAYYTFFPTWQSPSAASFLAAGMRDVSPYVLRVRALALQSQLHDGETLNPEVAVLGRFDLAFVLTYLAPLFVIALLHDLVSDERQSGRLRLLLTLPGPVAALWWRRAALRFLALFTCIAVPVVVGSGLQGLALPALASVLTIVAAYLAFWVGLAMIVGARPWRPATHAIALMGVWAVLTLVLPGLAHLVSARAAPVGQGIDLTLTQREHINAAWDRPRGETMQAFVTTHPEWSDTAPLPEKFHWKWYFAFHQLGDEAVAPDARAYRDGMLTRQSWSELSGWVLPGVAVQVALQRLADTDLHAQLAFQDRVTAFHDRLRAFYYPFVFNDVRFTRNDVARLPRFKECLEAAPPASTPQAAWAETGAHNTPPAATVAAPGWARVAASGMLMLLLGGLAVRRIRLDTSGVRP
ncbi:ABC transporter permease [Pigmentiphaga litoralis]|uniref:ABC transporter permease n=1 Tax=Pigmentiphaga litoralis TaxID=516702 RepID=UPI003B43A2A2